MRAWISRPHDGQTRFRLRHSSALFWRPASAISQPAPRVATASVRRCGSSVTTYLLPERSGLLPSVGVRLEVQLATASIGYVRVELGSREVGVSEHFLNRTEV